MAGSSFFAYRFDRRWAALFTLLGVDDEDGVLIDGTDLVATYGRVRIKTPLSNIDDTEVTGPHRWYTAVGLRLSAADSGITFGTNHQRGLCIAFKKPVPRIIGLKNHAALWVSVTEPEALAAAIDRAGR